MMRAVCPLWPPRSIDDADPDRHSAG